MSAFKGSGRAREGGFAAVHLPDFKAHYSGTAFRHTSDQLDMNPALTIDNNIFNASTVQGTLEKITAFLNTTGQGFVAIGDGYNVSQHADIIVGSIPTPTLESAFTAAFAHERLKNGGVILVKAGKYYLNSTVTVPAGFVIMGELGGTIIKGEMSNQPMFLIQHADDRPVLNIAGSIAAQSPINRTMFVNIVLADNLDGYVASGGPSMSSVPMVRCQTGSNFTCENVSFFGRMGTLGAGPGYGRSHTQYAIGYATYGSTETSLILENCIFDGLQQMLSFAGTGANDKLIINKCNVRAYGTEAAADSGSVSLNSYILTANAVKVIISDSYFNPGVQNGTTAQSYIRALMTILSGDQDVIIVGNRGSTIQTADPHSELVLTLIPGSGSNITAANNVWNGKKISFTSSTFGTITTRVLVSQTWAADCVRTYNTGDGSVLISTNAYWDGANWNQDTGTKPSSLFQMGVFAGTNTKGIYHQMAGHAAWGDAAWLPLSIHATEIATSDLAIPSNYNTALNQILVFAAPTAGPEVGDSNPDTTVAVLKNGLYAKNIVKAWGYVKTDGAGGITFKDTFGLDPTYHSAGVYVSGSGLSIQLQNAMTSSHYTVIANVASAGDILVPKTAISSSSLFVIAAYKSSTEAFKVPTTNVQEYSFIVLGES